MNSIERTVSIFQHSVIISLSANVDFDDYGDCERSELFDLAQDAIESDLSQHFASSDNALHSGSFSRSISDETFEVSWSIEPVEYAPLEEGQMAEELAGHSIEYSYRDVPEGKRIDIDEAHVKGMILEGYHSGELCHYDSDTEEEYRGWWSIRSAA